MADVKAIAEELVNLTVKEVTELKTILKDEYGIEPAAAAVAVAGPAAAAAGEAAAEKSSFDVNLKDAGASKLQVIKAVKTALGLGLKEAKELVDGAPSVVQKDMERPALRLLRRPLRRPELLLSFSNPHLLSLTLL